MAHGNRVALLGQPCQNAPLAISRCLGADTGRNVSLPQAARWYSVRAGTNRMWRAIWMMVVVGLTGECLMGAGPADPPSLGSFGGTGAGTTNQVKAPPIKVETHTLKNGLKILIHEDHSIPTVASYILYRIGSRNEGPGTTGLSHFFEHMMFNGAKKYGPKQFDRVMEAAGGANNAYTDQDVTVYQDWFPSTALELIFDLESDRIENLSFDPKMIQSEREVVASERRTSVEANNGGLLDEQMWAAAFTAHPYHWPVIGWMSDIEHWKMDDLKKHFDKGYALNNA